MSRIFKLFFSLLFVFSGVEGQVVNGITGIPDTSFTVHSEWVKNKKHFPGMEMPKVSPEKYVKEKRSVIFHRIGERALRLDAFYPDKEHANGVAFIFLFGGGWRSGNREQHHDLAVALANKGYTCFTPDYRLSTEAFYPAAVFDVKNAVKWVRVHAGEFNADSSKLVIGGFSAGGQLAALVGVTGDMPAFEDDDKKEGISTKVSAIVDIDGTLSFALPTSSEFKEPDKIMASSYWMGYTYGENPVLFKSASPLGYARYSPPIIFLNSPLERMHSGREDYIKILKDKNIYYEIHEFGIAPHSFCLFEPWFTPVVSDIDAFLKKVFE